MTSSSRGKHASEVIERHQAVRRAAGGIRRRIGGGWQVAAIHQVQSGFPFTISVFGDTVNAGALLNVNPGRANVVPGARRTDRLKPFAEYIQAAVPKLPMPRWT